MYETSNGWRHYVGQSRNVRQRLKQHQAITDSLTQQPKNPHYLVARETKHIGGQVRYVLLGTFTDNNVVTRLIMENIMMLLLNAYHPRLREEQSDNSMAFWQCQTLVGLADAVFTANSWTISTGRGTNWSSPIWTADERSAIWGLITKDDRFLFRCSRPFLIGYSEGRRPLIRLAHNPNSPHTPRKLALFIDKDIWEEGPRHIHIVLEIMNDGLRHEIPYARLPDVGPVSDFAQAARLGIRAEWFNSSLQEWRCKYLQKYFVCSWMEGEVSRDTKLDAPWGYHASLRIQDWILGRGYNQPEEKPLWRLPLVPLVMEVTSDWLRQSLDVSAVQTPLRIAGPPYVPSLRENVSKLQANADQLEYLGGIPKVRGRKQDFAEPRTSLCDFCWLVRSCAIP